MVKKINFRIIIQIFFFALIALIVLNHSFEESGVKYIPFLSAASLHAICPFGGVVTLYEFFTTGDMIQKIHESSIVLMTISFFLMILFGPVICGWVCPLGSVQEWIGKIGRKINKKNYNNLVPLKLDKYLRYLRYVVLVWVVYVTANSGKLIFQGYDPYFALYNFWSGEVAVGSLIILGATLLLSLVIERPWCKYACPYGALAGISNNFRALKIKRNESTCISCGACDRACPMNIKVSELKVVKDHQCISCMECTSEAACPIVDTVEFKTSAKLEVQNN